MGAIRNEFIEERRRPPNQVLKRTEASGEIVLVGDQSRDRAHS